MVWADEINGTEQIDTITDTLNHDILRGFCGYNDITWKEIGDNISGGSGDAITYGNDGRDIPKGKSGNDLVQGTEGNDKIYRNSGHDILV